MTRSVREIHAAGWPRSDTTMIARATHCWLIDHRVFGDRREPGLLVMWDRRPDGWWGYVVSAQRGIGAHGDGPYALTWVPAVKIEPWD